ncbi:virulence-associated E family protein [Scytonema sp. UIC 10036]|uniref:virulence-associated E family protein n=1 Tax=Scytonema sp. UIC 10036 TaxID=2304196 RepID=UPI00140F812C|nr:virulence-associated E family protein [Scytonema sp. UIC 10036]
MHGKELKQWLDPKVAEFNLIENWELISVTKISSFIKLLKNGITYRGGIKEGDNTLKGFKYATLMSLDFDGDKVNKKTGEVIHKAKTYDEVLADEIIQQYGLLIYRTPGYIPNDPEQSLRFRVILAFDRHVTETEFRLIFKHYFQARYPMLDDTPDPGRLFYGTRDESYILTINDGLNRLPVDTFLKFASENLKAFEDAKRQKQVAKLFDKQPKVTPSTKEKAISVTEKPAFQGESKTEGTSITERVFKHLYEHLYMGYYQGSAFALYSLHDPDQSWKHRRLEDEQREILRIAGRNPFSSSNSNGSSFMVIANYGELPYFWDKSGNLGRKLMRENGRESNHGSYLDYYFHVRKTKFGDFLGIDYRENGSFPEGFFSQLVNHICDTFKLPKFPFLSKPIKGFTAIVNVLKEKFHIERNLMSLQCLLDGSELRQDTVQVELEIKHGLIIPNSEHLRKSILYLSEQNEKHPVKEYLLNCAKKYPTFDPDALETLSTKYFGTTDRIYDVYMKKMLVGGVARVMNPGCEWKHVVVLQGAQNARKSSFVRELAGGTETNWFNESIDLTTLSNKDQLHLVNSFWIHEIPEIDKAFRKADASALKDFIGRVADKFRAPYLTHPSTYLRTSIFFGTTNQTEILHDETGSTRYWVIPVQKTEEDPIDVDALIAEKDYLWAMAYHLYLSSPRYFADLTKEEAKLRDLSNQQFQEQHPWADQILSKADKYQQVTVRFLWERALNYGDKKIEHKDSKVIERILRMNGWIPLGRKTIRNEKHSIWENPETSLEKHPVEVMLNELGNNLSGF